MVMGSGRGMTQAATRLADDDRSLAIRRIGTSLGVIRGLSRAVVKSSRLAGFDRAPREAELAAVTVGPLEWLDGPGTLYEYDARWSEWFARARQRIRDALGERALLGACRLYSVPGLIAKPRIDIVLAVRDPGDEAAYAPALVAAGYILRIREPDWHEHRLFNGPDIDVNLHVFADGSPEITRMLQFRGWLRRHPDERERYGARQTRTRRSALESQAGLRGRQDRCARARRSVRNPLPEVTRRANVPHIDGRGNSTQGLLGWGRLSRRVVGARSSRPRRVPKGTPCRPYLRWIPLAVVARRRLCPGTSRVDRRAARAAATQLTHRARRRSSRSCVAAARACTVRGRAR